MITLTLNATDEKVANSLRQKGPVLIESLSKRLMWLMTKLQRKIQTEKLQGQVLNQRSGKLANSIRSEGVHAEGSAIVGSVQGAGGPAFYGAVHEYGGKGPYEIRPTGKKALAFFPSGSSGSLISKSDLRKMYTGPLSHRSLKSSALGKFRESGGVVVKSVMHPAALKRSFMASTLTEMSPEILSSLQESIDAEVSK